MKLLRLKITDSRRFRSLPIDFEVKFLNDKIYNFEPYCLAGRNGSGKSNVLEVLASIFYHLECMFLKNLPDGFVYDEDNNSGGYSSKKCNPDAFEVEYLYPLTLSDINNNWSSYKDKDIKELVAHISIVKKPNETPKLYWKNSIDYGGIENMELTGNRAKSFLPKKVIGYSSGENEILSLPFLKMRFLHYDEYLEKLKKDDFYGQRPEGRMVYIDNQLNQAVLLSILLLEDPENYKPLYEKIGIQGVKEFRIIIGKHHFELIDEDLYYSLKKEKRKFSSGFSRELTEKLKITLDKFQYCATTSGTIYEYYDGSEESKEYLYLDFKVDKNTIKAFRGHFETSLELFEALQILFTLNSYVNNERTRNRVYKSKNLYLNKEELPVPFDEARIMRFKNFNLKIKGIEDTIYTKSLSDGEHQLIHALGISLLYKDLPCLFLFDEPETHFNQDWRFELMTLIRNCFKSEITKPLIFREMLITTHSAYLISDCKEENVFLFEKENGIVSYRKPSFNTLGASINKISIEAFKSPITIGKHALSILEDIDKRFEQGENSESLIEELDDKLGESVEKLLLMHKLSD